MFWIISCCILIIFIILFLALSRLSITFTYSYIENDHLLMISVYFYKICLVRREMHQGDNEKVNIWELIEKTDDFPKKISNLFQKIQEVHYIATAILNKSEINHFKWHTKIGTGDASTTGMATGGGWIIKGMLVGMISEQSKLTCKPDLMIIPHFQERVIQSEVDCILSIRMGQTIYTFIKAMRKYPLKKEANI